MIKEHRFEMSDHTYLEALFKTAVRPVVQEMNNSETIWSTRSLGERISKARLYMGYTLNQAATAWQVNRGALVNWEYNGSTPREPVRTQLEYILRLIEAHYEKYTPEVPGLL